MLRSVRLVQAGLLISVFFALAACHHSGSGSSTPASYVRLVNATQSNSLGLVLNQGVTTNSVTTNVATTVATGVAQSSASGYTGVASGAYSSVVSDATNSLNSGSPLPLSLGGTYYTVIASQRDGVIQQNLIVDNQVSVAGSTWFTAPNFSVDAPTLDVYVVPPGTTDLTSYSATISVMSYGSAISPVLLAADTYEIIVTAKGNKDDVRLTLPSVTFASGEILTLALTATPGGGLVNGVLVQQGGPVTVVPASTARVRVVAALPATTPTATDVSATVGATTLADVASSPSPGSYTLVPAGSLTGYAVNVTGGGTGTASDPAFTFDAGGDYTILVYGSAGAPTLQVLPDRNQTEGSLAVLRLVNAANTSSVTLFVDGMPVTGAVAPYGSSTGYFGEDAASPVQFNSGAIPCSNCAGVPLESRGVYTYFVVGPSSAPYVIVSRDR
jgi:hypothetical protein